MVKSDFENIRQKIKELNLKRDIARGLDGKSIDSNNASLKRRKTLLKDSDIFAALEESQDKFALGSVDVRGSNFNSFKPNDGVTLIEGIAKVKKGNKIKPTKTHLSRDQYIKTFSQKPFELKSILTNTQSMKNLEGKKHNPISFYEDTLPPILSPRDRYKTERDDNLTHDFELDQSAIPKKADEMIVKGGDVSELINFEKTFLDQTQETDHDFYSNQKKQVFSSLPKFVNR